MSTLATLVVKLVGDTTDFQGKMEAAQRNAAAIGKKLESTGKAMTVGLTLPLVGLGVASIKAASDLEESLNKVRVVFGDNATAIESWSRTSTTAFGLSQQKALEAAGTFGNLFEALGMTETQMLAMSQGLVQLAGDLASFNNIDPTVALEKLRAGIVGEVEPLRALGVNLSEAAVQAKGLEMGLVGAGEEMSAQQKVMARYAIILDQTQTAQGDFGRTSDGLANSMRTLKGDVENLLAQMGEILLPIAKDLVVQLKDLTEWFIKLEPATRKTAVQIGLVAAAAGPALTVVGKLTTALGTLVGLLGGPVTLALGGIMVLEAALVGTLQKYADELSVVMYNGLDPYQQHLEQTSSELMKSRLLIEDTAGTTLPHLVFNLNMGTDAMALQYVELDRLRMEYGNTQPALDMLAQKEAEAAAKAQELADAAKNVAESLKKQKESAEGAWKANSQLVESLKGASQAEIAKAAIDMLTESEDKGKITWGEYATAVMEVQDKFGLADAKSRTLVGGLGLLTQSLEDGGLPAMLFDEALKLIIDDSRDGALNIAGINTQLQMMATKLTALDGRTITINILTNSVGGGGGTKPGKPGQPTIPAEDLQPSATNVTVYGGISVTGVQNPLDFVQGLSGYDVP